MQTKADYRFICPRCNSRYGVPHPRGVVDISTCPACATKKAEPRYADGKLTKRYEKTSPVMT